MLQILTVLALCLFCVCGHVWGEIEKGIEIEKEIETGTEIQNEAEVKAEPGRKEKPESAADAGEDITNAVLPANDTIKDSIYRYYYREETEKLSKEEILAAKGKLSATDLTIHSGEEFALIREWYNWDHSGNISVVFSENLQDWQEADLEALALLKGSVYLESSGKTFPARALTYLTGAREVIFSDDSDMTD